MGTNIKLKIDPADKILLKRNLNRNGKGQQFFTHEVRRRIEYVQPYARRQYYENRGNGLRGSHWTERMWADRGKEIIQSVAAYCGGKTK